MLNKNIYIMYPVGNYGNYLHWILNISEANSAQFTTANPQNLNCPVSLLPNSVTTNDLFIQRPPLMNITSFVAWLVKNKPTNKLVNPIETHDMFFLRSQAALALISQFDTGAVFINIYIDNDADSVKFVAINNFYNSPHFKDAIDLFQNLSPYYSFTNLQENSAINLQDRNNLVHTWKNLASVNTEPIDMNMIENFANFKQQWFNNRIYHNQYEMQSDVWQMPDYNQLSTNVYQIKLRDIFAADFVDKLETKIQSTSVGNFDFSYAKSFHNGFVNSQTHLQWFTDIDQFRQTKVASPYLLSTNFLQAMLVDEMINHWLSPSIDWENYSTEDLVKIISG